MDNLKKLRLEKNLSQQELANKLIVSQQSIYKYENGISMPDISTLIRMADYFETSVDYIIGHSDLPHVIEAVEPYSLNADEKHLIDMYRVLSSKQRNVVKDVAESYLDK